MSGIILSHTRTLDEYPVRDGDTLCVVFIPTSHALDAAVVEGTAAE